MRLPANELVSDLPNGLRLVAVDRGFGKGFAASLVLRAGNNDSPANMPSLAHLAEHLAFAGDNQELVEQLTERGTCVNAETSRDHVEFSVSGHVDDLEAGIQFLSSIVAPTRVGKDDVKREIEILHSELTDEIPDELCRRQKHWERFWARTLGNPNWRLGRTKELAILRKITPESVHSFRESYYQPANATLAIVAPVPGSEIRQIVEGTFANDPRSMAAKSQRISTIYHRKELTTVVDLGPTVWVNIVYLTEDTNPVTRFAANLVCHFLGGGPHSEFFKRFRRDSGTAYRATADDFHWLSCTGINCFTSIPTKKWYASVDFLISRLEAMAERGIDCERLERWRNMKIRNREMELDDAVSLALRMAYEAHRDADQSLLLPETEIRLLESLSIDEFNQGMRTLLSKDNRSLFVGGRIGPIAKFRIKRRLRR